MRRFVMGCALVLGAMATGAQAQVRTIDPNQAIDGDLAGPPPSRSGAQPVYPDEPVPAEPVETPAPAPAPASGQPTASVDPERTLRAAETFQREDLLAAGEGVFGKGAAEFAGLIERILKDQGQPNAYIAGREAAGAFVLGVRYGSGVMTHKVFVLVYNLYDSQDLYKRFPAAEGRLYAIGGFAATYLRRGNVVLIPVRLGVGWRAGVNVGYMRFSEKQKWLPF